MPPARDLLVPSAALLWGLQFAFLSPALALLLVAVFHASAAQVGGVLVVYNASGFVASLAIPAYADHRHDYLKPLLACGVLTLGLAIALAATTSLPVALVALVLFGAPAGVGVSLLFAHMKNSGATRSDVVRTRAIFSFAWVAGPPMASFIIASLGARAVLAAIGGVAVFGTVTTALMMRQPPAPATDAEPTDEEDGAHISRAAVIMIVTAFVFLQCTNNTVVTVMNLFVTKTLRLDVVWAGVALGVAAGLEVPVLLLIGRLGRRFADLSLIIVGCVAGLGYYAAMVFVSGPAMLVGLQVLNAVFYGILAGVGLTLFQRIISRPGLATGLFTNTRRIGAIFTGPLIALASVSTFGYRTVFAASAVLTGVALVMVLTLAHRPSTQTS